MADLIKKVKIKKQDGTFTDYIPIGAEASNINMNNNYSVQSNIGNVNVEIDGNIVTQLNTLKDTIIDMFFPNMQNGGDMSILTFKKGNQIKRAIVDFGSGGSAVYNIVKPKLIARGLTKFDYAFISHFHSDHVGQVNNFLNDPDLDFSETVFYLPTLPDWNQFIGSARYVPDMANQIIGYIQNHGNRIIYPTLNTQLNIFDASFQFLNCDTSRFEELYPLIEYYADVDKNVTIYNNFSMVLQITNGNQRLLFTGDMQKGCEDIIISQGLQVPTFLKMEHHSVTSLNEYSEDYLKHYWKPEKVVAMCPTYGMTAIRSLCKHTEMYITGFSGDVNVIANSKNLLATSENGRYNEDVNIEGYNCAHGFTGYLALSVPLLQHRLSENEDLNDYREPGTYSCVSTEICETLTNTPPFTGAFKLIVLHNTNDMRVIQYAIQNMTSKVWYRHGDYNVNNDTWTFSQWFTDFSLGETLNLPKNTDLNDLSIGNYCSVAGDVTETIVNTPPDIEYVGFSLICAYTTSVLDRYTQVLIENNPSGKIYIRTKTGTGWGSWSRFHNFKNSILVKNTDLNDVLPGLYTSVNTEYTQTMLNVPSEVSTAFNLECLRITDNDNRLIQRLIPNIQTPVIYYRILSAQGWSSWYKFEGTVVS